MCFKHNFHSNLPDTPDWLNKAMQACNFNAVDIGTLGSAGPGQKKLFIDT